MTYSISLLEVNENKEKELIQWAINNCPTFVYKTTTTLQGDEGFYQRDDFTFLCEQDAMWFRLHWQ